MRTIVECSPQFGQTERARSGAGSSRSGSGPEVRRAQPRLTAARADVAEIDGSSLLTARRSRATKNPSVPSRCGSVCMSRARGDGPRPGRRTAGRRPRTPGAAEEAVDPLLVLRRRDRAGGVDEHAAGRPRGAPRRGSRLVRGEPATSAGSLRQRWSGREASVPRPVHGGSTSTRSNAPRSAARRRRPSRPGRWPRPSASAVRASASARPGWRSTATIAALVAHQRGQMGRLAAGRGAQVEDPLAGLRVERRARPPSRRATAA